MSHPKFDGRMCDFPEQEPRQEDRERVLIVDDDAGVRLVLQRMLEDSGYRVETARCGREGLEAFRAAGAEPYQAVLLDLRMPDMTGNEVLKQLRAIDPDASVIMVTALEKLEYAVEALRNGALHYVTKPFEFMDVLDKVQEAVECRREAVRERIYRNWLEQREAERDARLHEAREQARQALGELEQSRQELLDAHKLSSIGLLAQGIAHNMRGPLTAIAGFASLLREKPDDPAKLDIIIKESRRLSTMVRKLMEKARNDQDSGRRPILINELLKEELGFLDGHLFFKHHVERTLELQDGVEAIEAVYSDFSHALVKLIQNAIDAMYQSEIRMLTVRTRQVDEYIEIEVGDTGEGIAPENLERIFEPYYTTRSTREGNEGPAGTGMGMGMGLFLSRRLLAKYQATITVSSEPGQTVFKVRVPLAGNRVAPVGASN